MKTSIINLFFVCLLSTFFLNSSLAQKISIQSTLKDISGNAVPDGLVSITFKLYDVPENGTVLWSEVADVNVVGGIYSHKLGSVTALNPSNFGNSLYLGVTVGGKELSPRTELTYAPFAMSVKSIAGGGQSASFEPNGRLVVTGVAKVNGELQLARPSTAFTPYEASNGNPPATVLWINGHQRVTYQENLNTTHAGLNTFSDGIKIFNGITVEGSQGITVNNASVDARNGYVKGNKLIIGTNNNVPNGYDLSIWQPDMGINHHATETNRLDLYVANNALPLMTYKGGANGKVGISKSTPDFALHVGANNTFITSPVWSGFGEGDTGLQHCQSCTSGGTAWPNQELGDVVAKFDGTIVTDGAVVAAQSYTISDQRIKKIVGQSNSAKDLVILDKIKITDYTMIDKARDNKEYKKVIAQDVKEVFPQAVSISKNVLPNIYAMAKNISYNNQLLTIKLDKAHELVKGDKIDIYGEEANLTNTEVFEVIDANTFIVKSEKELRKIFVYGKYVNDFLAVDYDALSMLNISATQELHKKIIALEAENKALKTENNTIKSAQANVEERVAKLESMLSDNTKNNISTSTVTSGQK